MKLIGRALAWLLYWIGDAISRPMVSFDWVFIYPAYNKIMCLSADIGDWSDGGPWTDVPE